MMNDQTSPTADGQLPDPLRDPFEAPQSAHGLLRVPSLSPEARGSGGAVQRALALAAPFRADIATAVTLALAGIVVGALGGLAWYRFAPTVWLSIPADSVKQVTDGVDQSQLLLSPESKGLASVDGYYFVFMAIGGLLLGVLAFLLARRGTVRDGDRQGMGGAGVGAWAGVLVGGFAASTIAAALGRWISLPDPLTVLHQIAGGHNFHATVALHSRGLYVIAPLFGMVLFLALSAAFTKPPVVQEWGPYGERNGYFTQENPYGMPTPATGGETPAPWPADPRAGGH